MRGGHLRASSSVQVLHNTRGEYDAFAFTSHCGLVRFGRSCADGQREKACCRGANGAASVPERRSERLADFRPSGPTGHAQVVVDERHVHHFGALGGPRRGDRLQIDGQLVAHYIYSAKELQALRKGGVQRIYVGNVATGDHKLDVFVDGKLEGGADFSRTGQFTFRKEVKPKLVGLTLAGPRSGNTSITLGDW